MSFDSQQGYLTIMCDKGNEKCSSNSNCKGNCDCGFVASCFVPAIYLGAIILVIAMLVDTWVAK